MRVIDTILFSLSILSNLPSSVAKDGSLGESLLPNLHDSNLKLRQDAFDHLPGSSPLGRRAPWPQESASGRASSERQWKQSSHASNSIDRRDRTTLFDEQEFNQTATVACHKALDGQSSVVNPSGLAACYNVAFLDGTTGAFSADVRIYKISEGTDEFEGIPCSSYMMEMQMSQATLADSDRVNDELKGTEGSELLLNSRYVGELNPLLQLEKLKPEAFRILMIPNITITATHPKTNKYISTTLSSDTLSYVAGHFVDKKESPYNITLPEANMKLPIIIAGATMFVLPGTTLGIFPVGLIITCVWSGIFTLVVGYGTFVRKQFRDHYRRRLQMALTNRAERYERI